MKLRCINPQFVYWKNHTDRHGVTRSSVVTDYKSVTTADKSILRPCGYCRPCRKEKARQWTVRLVLEQMAHDESCFITLTYKDAPISVSKRDCQLFIKRLRKRLKKPIRYYLVAEYGDKSFRSHYHLILFGHAFLDGSLALGNNLYTHQDLIDTWSHGHVSIGQCTPASIQYCCNYVQKKFNGSLADEVYQVNGECISPPFALMSRNPAIGKNFFLKYKDQLVDHGTVVINNVEVAIPKYFKRILKDKDDLEMDTAPIDSNEFKRLIDISNRMDKLEVQRERNKASII